MSITKISVNRPSLIVVIFTIIAFLGFISYQSLSYELLPKISSPVISVSTMYPGASPSEVENSVTKVIEDAVSTLENVEGVQATSLESFSMVTVELKYGSDVDVIMQDAQRKINAVIAYLPEQAKEPSLGKFSLDELPIMRIGVTAEKLTPLELNNLVNNYLQPELARIEGVARVDMIGGEEREIKVNVNADKLRTYNLSLLQVSQTIAGANLDFPTGKIKNEDQQILVRLSGKFQTLHDLKNLILVETQDGSPIYLKDVAEIQDTKKEVATISRINGKTSLGLSISKQSDGNTVAVSEEVQKKIGELTETYKNENIDFTIAQDSAVFTLEAANSVIHDLVIAVILVAFIMLFFLHSIRNAVIVMVSIPLSIVATFIAMNMLGFTLNLMTLLALSLVVGILVDDSIVVLENIHSHMERGKSAREAAIACWEEIGISVVSITLVIVVVFLPIAFVSGLIADLLRQFSLVVAFATIISLFVSFTLTPLLASRFATLTHLNNKKILDWPLIAFEKFINGIMSFYQSFLTWTLRNKTITMAVVIAMIVSSFSLMTNGFIGSEFVASGDNGEFIISVELPKDATIEQTNFAIQQIENHLLENEEIVTILTSVGSGANSSQPTAYLGELHIKLVEAEKRTLSSDQYARATKHELLNIVPGVKLKASPVGMVGGGTAAPIQIVLQGNNIDSLITYSEDVVGLVKNVAGTTEVEASVDGGNPEISVDIDREKMANLGLSIDVVGMTMQNAFTGNNSTKFKDGEEEYDINIRLDAFDRRNAKDISELTFLNNQGQLINLSQFAEVVPSMGPSRLERKDKMTTINVSAQVTGRSVGEVGQEIQDLIAQQDTPSSITATMGGDIESQQEAFASLGFALMTSILLVYLIMVALYDSYIYPFVVMFSVPVALVGALLALALAMQNMSIFSMLGLIMLVGLVVKNAILIVDYTNQMKEEGKSSYKAVIEGGVTRFRPILMTTIAMVIAMIPIAIAIGAGAEWKNGLAWVLIGGLTSSMILTLIVVPIMYLTVDNIKAKLNQWFGKKEKQQLQVEI